MLHDNIKKKESIENHFHGIGVKMKMVKAQFPITAYACCLNDGRCKAFPLQRNCPEKIRVLVIIIFQ